MKYSDLTHCEFHDLVKRGEAAGAAAFWAAAWASVQQMRAWKDKP